MNNKLLEEIRGRLGALELIAVESLMLGIGNCPDVQEMATKLKAQFAGYQKRFPNSHAAAWGKLTHDKIIDSAMDGALQLRAQCTAQPADKPGTKKSWLRRKFEA